MELEGIRKMLKENNPELDQLIAELQEAIDIINNTGLSL